MKLSLSYWYPGSGSVFNSIIHDICPLSYFVTDVNILWLFGSVPGVGLQCVNVVFLDYTIFFFVSCIMF